jgi:hypothetical protein
MKHARKTDAAAEELYRADTIPPPDGESLYQCETKLGDFSLAIAEARLAAENADARSTTKMDVYDYAAALRKQRQEAKELNPPLSGTRMRMPVMPFVEPAPEPPALAPMPTPAPVTASLLELRW